MREKRWNVCAITIADHEKVIFQGLTEKEAENFAMKYDGAEKEVFIKPVWVLLLTGRDT